MAQALLLQRTPDGFPEPEPGGPKLPGTAALGDLISSSGIHRYYVHVCKPIQMHGIKKVMNKAKPV